MYIEGFHIDISFVPFLVHQLSQANSTKPSSYSREKCLFLSPLGAFEASRSSSSLVCEVALELLGGPQEFVSAKDLHYVYSKIPDFGVILVLVS